MIRSTLGSLLQDAGLEPAPWTNEVPIVHPYDGTPIEPRKYQVSGLAAALSQPNHRYGLYDDMGTGKSLISYAYSVVHASLGNRVLVCMPPKLLRQYRKNFFAMLPGVEKHISMEIYHGTPKQRAQLDGHWREGGRENCPDIILTSFEFFRREPMKFTFLFDCEVFIGDEVKWLSNIENTTYQSLQRFMGADGNRAALVMNGTPARNTLVNLYGYINFVTPDAYSNIGHFNRSHVDYESFMISTRTKEGRDIERKIFKIAGYRNRELLFQNLYRQGRRVVLPLATKLTVIPKEFDLSPKHATLYRKLVEERLLMFEDDTVLDITEMALVRNTCMKAIINPAILQLNEESEVINTVREMLDEVDFGKTKVLLTAHYQATIELLLATFAEYNPVALYGKVTGAKAEQNKQRFLTDPDCKILVINYESGGVGLDGLQHVCHIGIAVEPTTIPGDLQQTMARLHRPGQKDNVTFWALSPMGTLYPKLIKNREVKQAAIDSVVNRARMTKQDLRAELLGE